MKTKLIENVKCKYLKGGTRGVGRAKGFRDRLSRTSFCTTARSLRGDAMRNIFLAAANAAG